jgi:hypothetical protein
VLTVLPSPDEFAALVAAFPEIPELPQLISAEQAGEMIGIKPSSIRIAQDAPGGWRLDTLVAWRAGMPGRDSSPGRPPADTDWFVAVLRDSVPESDRGSLTVVRVRELLPGLGKVLARRVFTEFTGREPVRGRVAGN